MVTEDQTSLVISNDLRKVEDQEFFSQKAYQDLTRFVRMHLGASRDETFKEVLGDEIWEAVTAPVIRAYRIEYWATAVAYISILLAVFAVPFDLALGIVPDWFYVLLMCPLAFWAFIRQTGFVSADEKSSIKGTEKQIEAYKKLQTLFARMQAGEIKLLYKLGPLSDDAYKNLPSAYLNSKFSVFKLLGAEGEYICRKRGFWHVYYRDIVVMLDPAWMPQIKEPNDSEIDPASKLAPESQSSFECLVKALKSKDKHLRELSLAELNLLETGLKPFDQPVGAVAKTIEIIKLYQENLPAGKNQAGTIEILRVKRIAGATSRNSLLEIITGNNSSFNKRLDAAFDFISSAKD